MPRFNIIEIIRDELETRGLDLADLILGTDGQDTIDGLGGDDIVIGLGGDDVLRGGDGLDIVLGRSGRDTLEGGADADVLLGGKGGDRVVGNKGDDEMFGGAGNDLLVWNNGDGSDLMDGGAGRDRQQVNFDTDLVDDDLQNDDVAQFSVSDRGIAFARTEVNGQTERGLFQLDIRDVETQETNFGGGHDVAVLLGDVLDRIRLELDGGDGVDTVDLSGADGGVRVNLASGRAGSARIENFEDVIGSESDDLLDGDAGDNAISGLGGADRIRGREGEDVLVGGKGDDFVFGGSDDDLLVWNNGDGSDLLNGGKGHDRVQVNFDTDLVDDDLRNDDVASFDTGPRGVAFARTELNGQTERGLFELDIRKAEALETNFGGGDDTAALRADVLGAIRLDLDGGAGTDRLDASGAASGVAVDLAAGVIGPVGAPAGQAASTAVGFEDVVGSAFGDVIVGDAGDNVIDGGAGDDVIRAGSGDNVLRGGAGADDFVFVAGETGVNVILDFEVGVDRLIFEAAPVPALAARALTEIRAPREMLEQVGDDVEVTMGGQTFLFAEMQAAELAAADVLLG